MPSLANWDSTSSKAALNRDWSSITRSLTAVRVAPTPWPSVVVVRLPIRAMRCKAATRTRKNSSRLLEKMPRKRMRSISGMSSSSASCRTRSLNASQLTSRLKNSSSADSPCLPPALLVLRVADILAKIPAGTTGAVSPV